MFWVHGIPHDWQDIKYMTGRPNSREAVWTASYYLITPLGLPLFSTIEPKGKSHIIILSPQGEEVKSLLLELQTFPPECHEEQGGWCWSGAMSSLISVVHASLAVAWLRMVDVKWRKYSLSPFQIYQAQDPISCFPKCRFIPRAARIPGYTQFHSAAGCWKGGTVEVILTYKPGR